MEANTYVIKIMGVGGEGLRVLQLKLGCELRSFPYCVEWPSDDV